MKSNIKSTKLLRNLSALLIGGSMLTLLPSTSEAAVFAKYDGVDGESSDANHDKWIDVLSIDWGSNKPGGGATGQSRRRGGVIIEDLTLTIEYEKASPKLQEACLNGKVFPKVEIDIVESRDGEGREPYLTYKLKDVLVTSFALIVAEDGSAAMQLSMSFSSISQTYTNSAGNTSTLKVDGSGRRAELTEEPVEPTPKRP